MSHKAERLREEARQIDLANAQGHLWLNKEFTTEEKLRIFDVVEIVAREHLELCLKNDLIDFCETAFCVRVLEAMFSEHYFDTIRGMNQ